ncbi:MAG: PAS domain S-box protein [Nitrospiraceae bacterium]|nr:PAS domain S-box protein [Nitrospiraceae bacterium]
MNDDRKTREELIRELAEARLRIAEFEALKDEFRRVESVMRQAVLYAKEEKARTEAIIEAIGDGISVQDTDFRVLLQNQLQKEMVGEHVGEFCYRAYQKRDQVCEGCHLAMAYRDGRIHKKEQVRETDRGTFYYEITASPLKDESGRIIAGIEAVRDITERKNTEKALRAAEEMFRSLVERSFVGIYIIQDGLFAYINPKFAEVFGYDQEELLMKPYMEMIAEENRDLVAANVRRRLGGEVGTLHYLFRGIRKDGSVVDVEVQGTTTEYNGKKAIIGTLIDITERRRLEREVMKSQKLESLGVLAAGIAHEYNNALTAISGNISLAAMYAKPGSEMADILGEAEKAAQKAEKLTRELSIFSKGGTLFKTRVAAAELISSLAAEHRGPAAGPNTRPDIRIELSVLPGLWHVDVDIAQFGQAMNNIIENAIESMPGGGVILIAAENLESPPQSLPAIRQGAYIRISVSDRGHGISETHIEKIFEPFFTTKEKSSGLGLTAAASIIEGHDGYITVESAAGDGSTFHVYLPAATEQADAPGPENHSSLGRRTILVMDDEELVRTVTERMLNQCGCFAVFASDGEEMLEKYREAREAGHPFDAVIMDLVISSGMGGKEAIAKLLEIDPGAKAIVSSGYADDRIMQHYREYGFRGVLPKPYPIPMLLRVLRDVLIFSE